MKALVLCSGGVDSSTCLALAVKKYGTENVAALSVSYGQKHSRELEAAEKIAAHYGVELKKIDLAAVFEGSDCSLLKGSKAEIPAESYGEQLKKTGGEPVSTYVPFRNGLFLSCAASVALSKGCEEIFDGAHSDDAAGNAYPDCSAEFNDSMNRAIFLGSGNKLRVTAPFIGMNKAQVVAKGLELGVPFEKTWSCYEGGEPCGVCGTCRDRAAAFEANSVRDPLMKESVYHGTNKQKKLSEEQSGSAETATACAGYQCKNRQDREQRRQHARLRQREYSRSRGNP